jgi:Protein of unknown function (DUF1761)
MDDVNFVAVAVAAVAVWIVSTGYYIVFTKQMATLHPAYAEAAAVRPPPWKIVVELIRNLVVASVVAWLAQRLDVTEWIDGVALGLTLWVGFPVVLWAGAVMWEKVPPKLAAIHAGDWVLKLVVIGVIVSVWT